MFASLLTTTIAEGPPPLIDLDWTVVIQFALFVIMFAILSRWLFKPYLTLRDARELGISGARHEAESMQARSQKLIEEHEAQLYRAKLRAAEERARLRAEGAASERQLLGATRDEVQRALGDARARIRTQAQAARGRLETEAAELAAEVARKILGRELT